MRVGVTGGTGFIGAFLIRDYADRFDFVVATSKKEPKHPVPGVEYCWTDYSEESFRSIFHDCDAVVHLASHVMMGMDKEIDVAPYVQNLTLADDLFRAAKTLAIRNVINASSVAVYKHVDDRPTNETDLCCPKSVYGIIKLAIEKLADLYNDRYDMRIKSLRFGQGLGIPNDINSNRFWSVLLRNCLEGKAIPVWIGAQNNGRDLIYVKDMALAIVKALEHPELTGCYNIGTGVLATNLEVAEAFCEVFQNHAGISFIEPKEAAVDRA